MEHSTLIRHIEAGLTHREIAKTEGVAEGTIQYWLRKYGLRTKWRRGGWSREPGCPHKGGKKALREWDWPLVQATYDQEGLSLKRLAKRFKTCIATLLKASKAGLLKTRSISEACKLAHSSGQYDYSIYRTPKFRKNAAKNGGYKEGSGCGKGAWMSNTVGQSFWLQSSYETRMATLLNEAQVLWERPQSVPYSLDGITKRYYADFILPDLGIYLDTKNTYLIQKDTRKIEAARQQNAIDLRVVSNDQITADFIRQLARTMAPTLQTSRES